MKRKLHQDLPIFLLEWNSNSLLTMMWVIRDMEYYQTKDPIYQELMKQAAEGKATGFIAVSAEF